MKTIILLDTMNCFVRNFSAISLSNANGEHSGGSFGTLQSIVKCIEDYTPDFFYAAWEGKHSSKRRRDILSAYKEGRKFSGFNRSFETSKEDESEAFSRQLNVLKEIFSEIPIYQGSIEYLEADDVIAYLCKYTLKDKHMKIIVSCDRDFFQLLDSTTIIFRPNTYKVEGSKYRKNGELVKRREYESNKYCIDVFRKDVNDKYVLYESIKIWPQNHILIKCFGEPADNISGISGVGEKTILKDFPFLDTSKDGSNYQIEDLLTYAEQCSTENKRYKKYLTEENREILLRNQKLIQLLDPDISLKSIKDIEGTLCFDPSFNTFKFRMHLIKEGISPKRIDDWIAAFNSLSKEKIEL